VFSNIKIHHCWTRHLNVRVAGGFPPLGLRRTIQLLFLLVLILLLEEPAHKDTLGDRQFAYKKK
jgi:hypothetical protein